MSNQTYIPESELFQAIREVANVGGQVWFTESHIGANPEPEVQISRESDGKRLRKIVNHELGAVRAIREWLHEAT